MTPRRLTDNSPAEVRESTDTPAHASYTATPIEPPDDACRRASAANLEDYPPDFYWTWHDPDSRYYTWIENDNHYGTWWTVWFNHGDRDDYTWISHRRMSQWYSQWPHVQ